MTGWILLSSLLVSCSGKDKGGDSEPGLPTIGCFQGVVINGLTAERIALPVDDAKGLQVLVRDSLRAGTSLVDDVASNPLLAGEYYMCDVPLDEEFPVFVAVDGYEAFEGEIKVHSTAPSRSPKATADLVKPYPTEVANIRLYPKNTQVKDLEVLVTNNGAPLAGAQVILRSQGANFLDPLHTNFLAPKNSRAPSQTITTGADGKAVFPAAELVLGGHYTYTVLPPDGGATQTVAAGTFIVGLRSDASDDHPYLLTVNLNQSVGSLAILSKSTDGNDPNPSGTATIYFNREIEIVPGTEDGIRASLEGEVTAKLVADNASNKAPDSVTVTIEANKLTLTPVFETKPDADTTKEPDLAVTFSGILLRPKASPNTLDSVTASVHVQFYR